MVAIDELDCVIKELKEVNLVLSKKQDRKRKDQSSLDCKLCSKTFESETILQQHFREEIVYCLDCNFCQYANTDNIPEEHCLNHKYIIDSFRCPL